MKILTLFSLTTILFLFTFNLHAQTQINDADNDTRVETERNANEDMIRYRIGGTDKFRMMGSTFETLNNGRSVFIGENAGVNDDATNNANIMIGYEAGQNTTSGPNNVAIGFRALKENLTGQNNFALGRNSMEFTTGSLNVGLGALTMRFQTTGSNNVAIGQAAGQNNETGVENVFIGSNAGRGSALHSKSGCVMIGNRAGFSDITDNKLYIENSDDVATPLIYGDFASNRVGIGTSTLGTDYALSVAGKVISTEVRVLETMNWPDYVFLPNYDLKSLEEVNDFIKTNGHLPNIPSAEEAESEGIALGEMNKNLLEKIEELTLYMIEMNEDVKKLKAENEALKKEVDTLKK